MAGKDVAAVIAAVIQIATAIQGLGNNWYRATADWDNFPSKIAELQSTHEFWKQKFMQSDMLSDPSLMTTFCAAEELLQKEIAKLESRQATGGCGCWPKVCMTMFPARVGSKIQRVIDAFDVIPRMLQMEEDGAAAVEKWMMRNSSSLHIRDDDRYVPLKATEAKVQKALDDPTGDQVVLLHGTAGKGKTTLAAHVALHYQRTCKTPEALFELVVFLKCGPKADTATKQLDLAQSIGLNPGATAVTQEKGPIGTDIQQRLRDRLKNQRILITFDDVWEPEFLQEMLKLCGVGVKCLVTSQDRALCDGLSYPAIKIQIEDIEENVCMEILASHVGFTNKQIPAHIQGVAHKMIEGTEGNPWALTSVARAIDSDRSDELEEWEAASQHLVRLLQFEPEAFILGLPYPKSFWVATRSSIDSLAKDSRSLFILLHMCDGTSVPEEVLHILYDCAIHARDSEIFEMSRTALGNKGLVKISHQTQEYDTQRKQYSWSAHALHKSFIEHQMSKEKETMLKLLARPSDDKHDEAGVQMWNTTDFSVGVDNKLWFSLCALYLSKEYIKDTWGTGILPEKLNNLRRNAIEPITRLLAVPISDRWTSSARSSAEQALQNIATVETETALLDENSGALMKSVLNFLKNLCSTSDMRIARAAGAVFVELSRNKLHHGVIISSGILDTITAILSSESDTGLLLVCTNILTLLNFNDHES